MICKRTIPSLQIGTIRSVAIGRVGIVVTTIKKNDDNY